MSLNLNSYAESTLEPQRIRAYARKVAAQAAASDHESIPRGQPAPVYLVTLAPAEGYRQVRAFGNEEYVELSHEGCVFGLLQDGTLVEGLYSYGKSWPVSEPETLDLDKISHINFDEEIEFKPLEEHRFTYLDVGRDRWHSVTPPRTSISAIRSRFELNTRRHVIVSAKGVGLSRALRDLYISAGGVVGTKRQ
jgi:hypothetical protein